MDVNKPSNVPTLARLLKATLTASMNDAIDADRSSLSNASLDHLAALVVSTGRGSLLVKGCEGGI